MQPSEPEAPAAPIAVVAVLVGLGLLTIGAIAYAVLAEDEVAEPEEPRIVVLPMREPEPPLTPPVPEPNDVDVGGHEVRAVGAGCGKEPPHHRRDTMHMVDRKITVFVPTGYQPDKPTPLVMLFHDDHETANGFFWDTGFEQVAEENDVLLAFPRDQDLQHWRDLDDIHVGEQALRFMDSILCVDHERVYLVGNGSGGEMAERLACIVGARAIATTAYRSGPQIACADKKTPYIHIANLDDGYLPPRGGEACHGVVVPSLDQQEALWRQKNGCAEKRRSYFRTGPHQCWSYGCETSFVTCHLDAGRGWPLQDKKRALDIFGCDNDPPTDFPLAAVIWRFFASHTP